MLSEYMDGSAHIQQWINEGQRLRNIFDMGFIFFCSRGPVDLCCLKKTKNGLFGYKSEVGKSDMEMDWGLHGGSGCKKRSNEGQGPQLSPQAIWQWTSRASMTAVKLLYIYGISRDFSTTLKPSVTVLFYSYICKKNNIFTLNRVTCAHCTKVVVISRGAPSSTSFSTISPTQSAYGAYTRFTACSFVTVFLK